MADELKQTLYWEGSDFYDSVADGTFTPMTMGQSHDSSDSTYDDSYAPYDEFGGLLTLQGNHWASCDSCTYDGVISFVRVYVRAKQYNADGTTVKAAFYGITGTPQTITTSWTDYHEDWEDDGTDPWTASSVNGAAFGWEWQGSGDASADELYVRASEIRVEVWGPEATDFEVTPSALHLVASPKPPTLDGAISKTSTPPLHLVGSVKTPTLTLAWATPTKLTLGKVIRTPMAWGSRTPDALHLEGEAKTPSLVPEGVSMSPAATRARATHWGAAAINGPGIAGVPHRLRISGEVQPLPATAKHTAYSGAIETNGITAAILHALIYAGTDTRIGDESLDSSWDFVQILGDTFGMADGHGGLDTNWFGFETTPDDGTAITSVQLHAAIWLYCNDPGGPLTPPTYPDYINQLEFRVEVMGTTVTFTPAMPMHHVHPSVGTPGWQPNLIRSTSVMTAQPDGSPWSVAAVNDIQARILQYADQVPGDPDGRSVWMVVAEAWLELNGVEQVIQTQDVYEAVQVTTQHYSIISPRVAAHELLVVRVGEAQ